MQTEHYSQQPEYKNPSKQHQQKDEKKYDTYTEQKHSSARKTNEAGLEYSSVAEYLPSM